MNIRINAITAICFFLCCYTALAVLPIPNTEGKVKSFWEYESCGPEIKDSSSFFLVDYYKEEIFRQAVSLKQMDDLLKFIYYSRNTGTALEELSDLLYNKLTLYRKTMSKAFQKQSVEIQNDIISYAEDWGERKTRKLIKILPKGKLRSSLITKLKTLPKEPPE